MIWEAHPYFWKHQLLWEEVVGNIWAFDRYPAGRGVSVLENKCPSHFFYGNITPPKTNGWNLKIHLFENENHLNQTSMTLGFKSRSFSGEHSANSSCLTDSRGQNWNQSNQEKGFNVTFFGYTFFFVMVYPGAVTVTTRIIAFLVGNPYKPLFATVTGRGVVPSFSDGSENPARIHRLLGCPHLTNLAPEKWWLGDDPFLLEKPIFRGELLVSRRVHIVI